MQTFCQPLLLGDIVKLFHMSSSALVYVICKISKDRVVK